MKILLDTSSLLAIVKYYLPFDPASNLKNHLEESFKNGEIVIIDKVSKECKYQSGGIILTALPFLDDKNLVLDTTDILPPKKFFNLVDNNFCIKSIVKQKGLNQAEYDVLKNAFLNSADCKLLLVAEQFKADSPFIITEESMTANDGKIFHKIPSNCQQMNIICQSVTYLLKDIFNFTPAFNSVKK